MGVYVNPIYDADTLEQLTLNNNIHSNRIGTDKTGTFDLGNCWQGIRTYPILNTVIGSITEDGRNTISGNRLDAIWCGDLTLSGDDSSGGACSIAGNNIGTDVTGFHSVYNSIDNIPIVYPGSGTVTLVNNYSLSNVGAPGGTSPGGDCTGFCNLISGNYSNGVGFDGGPALETGGVGVIGIFNNYIGTTKDGTAARANLRGVDMFSTVIAGGSPTTLLGSYGDLNGQHLSGGNLISGNNAGVSVSTNGRGGDYLVLGNSIGTDRSGRG